MPNYVIRKNFHRALPLTIGLWYKKKEVHKTVCFNNSARYKIEGEDMFDINKLFGIGYFFSPHKDSARFGWRYDLITNKIELFAYCYVDGKRIREWFLCDLSLEYCYRLGISITSDQYVFTVIDGNTNEMIAFETIRKYHKKKFSYPLGIYFGGQKAAPHRITVKMGRA